MNRFYIYLLPFFLWSSTLFAQDSNLTALELDSIAASLAEQQQYEEAVQYSQLAIKQAEKLGKQDSLYAKVLERLGAIYYDMYRDAEAGKIFEKVAAVYKRTHGPSSYKFAQALKSVAVIESSLKNFEKAEYIYNQVEPTYKKLHGEESAEYAFLLGDLAVLYDNWNREELAESMYLRAMEIEKKVLTENDLDHALSLSNFAIFYSKFQQYEKALALHQKALAIYKKKLGTAHSKYAHALTNLGITYSNMGNYTQAIKILTQASNLYAKIYGKSHQRYIHVISNLASFYNITKKYSKAEALLLESLVIHENNVPSLLQKITIYRKIAAFYSSTRQLSKALEYGFKAIYYNSTGQVDTSSLKQLLLTASQYSFRNPNSALQTLDNIATAFYYQYQEDNDTKWLYKSQQCYKAVLGYMNNYKNQFAFNRDKFRVLKKMSPIIEGQIQTLVALNKTDTTKDHLLEIFRLVEQNKSILLMDALQTKKNNSFGSLPDSLLQKETSLRVEFDKLQKIKLTSSNSNQLNLITQQIAQLNSEIKNFTTYLKTTYPKYYAFNYSPQDIDLAQIQKLIKPKELLVEYFLGKNHLYILSISKNTIACQIQAVDQNELAKLVRKFRKSLSDYSFITNDSKKAFQEFCISSSALYELLLKPITKQLQEVDQLTIVPDGLLGHIPFEVLLSKYTPSFDNFSAAPYLIHTHSIRYSYSAALLAENHNNRPKNSNNKILGLAAAYGQQIDSNLLANNYRSYKDVGLRKILKPLPAAIEEVEMLAQHFDGKFVTGQQATEAFFKQEATPYGIVHLAMHGILDWNYPILSNMAFTEDHDSLSDNFLYASEISNMELNANLVVLSACETGYGKFKQGEGVLSLARSFMYAGVPSLVVSLWQVNDASTAKIMNYFYTNLAKGQDKAVALQQAKLSYLKEAKGIAAHPAFWAAFVQLGNKTAIQIQTKSNNFWWYLLAGLGIVIPLTCLSVFYYKKRKKIG